MQQQMTQHFQEHMFQPLMTQMQGVQESLHSDIVALDSRFEDMPSSEQFGQLEARQQQLEQRFDTFSVASRDSQTTSTRSFRLQCRLHSSTRISRSTHRHLLHRRWIDLLGNWCQRGRWTLECLDLGGADGLHWRSFAFASTCYSCFICVELCVALHIYVLLSCMDLWLEFELGL